MILKSNHFSSKLEFWQQLVVTLAIGFTLLAAASSIFIATINNKAFKTQIVQQAIYLTDLISRQSRLALLYESTTAASEIATVALQFPDVVGISIFTEKGEMLYHQGESIDIFSNVVFADSTELHYENDEYLLFVAPVVTEKLETSLWDSEQEIDPSGQSVEKKIGYVTLVYSKQTLAKTQDNILKSNIGVSFVVALVLLGAVIVLTRRMTNPLKELSGVMARAQKGEINLRASRQGPKDISSMQESFNTMMAAIELRNDELRKARDIAIESAKIKSQFAANVSHELRTPMNSVLGMLDLLVYMGLTGKQQEYIETAKGSAQGLLALIDGILSYVHAESGQIVIHEQNVDLTGLVEDILNLLGTQALRKKLDIGYTISDIYWVHIDYQHLKQVLINLIGNAIKFTDSGEIAVTIGTESADDESRIDLLISVKDSGVGIRSENYEKIFEAFTQEDASTTRKYGGTGLGLAICKQYVTLMGGRISVKSEACNGSEFIVRIPVKIPSNIQSPVIKKEQLNTERILVADDSTVVRGFLNNWVEDRGGYVDSACNAVELLSLLSNADADKSAYTYLFVDEDLPGLNLIDLLKLIVDHPSAKNIHPIVMVNPWNIEGNIGLDGYILIEKPLFNSSLEDVFSQPAEYNVADKAINKSTKNTQYFNKKILIVDDNRGNRLVAGAMIEQFGCEAFFAENGQEAIDKISRKSFDMVFMDCNMPVMDGYDAIITIRKFEKIVNNLPVIAMTANNSVEERERCNNAGMNDFLIKPLTMENLRATLLKFFPENVNNGNNVKAYESYDREVLDRLRENVGEVFNSVIDAFIDDFPMYLNLLRIAISENDQQQVYELAHTIKGSSSNLGLESVSAIALQLESMGHEKDLRGAELLFNELETLLLRVCDELRLYQNSADNGDFHSGFSEEKPVILLADDDRSMRISLANSLRSEGYRIIEVTNGQSVLAICARSMPDIIMLDAIMPEIDGFEACKRIRQLSDGIEVPVLIVTSLEDEQSIARAFSVGATDYITKPINFSVLRRRVSRLLQASKVEKDVRKLAYEDVLTGLPNRAYFNQQLRHKISRASLNHKMLAVLFLDLDRFKLINDSLGHDAGDLILKAVADRLVRCVRKNDLVARLGGDEFTVVLENIESRDMAGEISKKICDALKTPFVFLHQRMFITASIGIAFFPNDGSDMNTLVKHADTAMFKAKEQGTPYCFYQSDMEDEITLRLKNERGLRSAIERDEITFFYQPQIDLTTMEVVGFESLARWNHPDRGILSAIDFIPIAEETGIIGEFARLAFANGCDQLQKWYHAGLDVRLAVNVSGGEFQDGHIGEKILSLFDHYDFPPHMLEIEITETMLMEHPELAQSELEMIRERGHLIAIDDFGSGFSSLNYLKKFSVDILKIDRAFVKDCHIDKNDRAIILSIVTLAHSLNLKVVAEGVELPEQVDYLKEIGCDIAQGYYFGRPSSAVDIQQAIDSGTLKVKTR